MIVSNLECIVLQGPPTAGPPSSIPPGPGGGPPTGAGPSSGPPGSMPPGPPGSLPPGQENLSALQRAIDSMEEKGLQEDPRYSQLLALRARQSNMEPPRQVW